MITVFATLPILFLPSAPPGLSEDMDKERHILNGVLTSDEPASVKALYEVHAWGSRKNPLCLGMVGRPCRNTDNPRDKLRLPQASLSVTIARMGLLKTKKKDYSRWHLYILKCRDGSLYTGIARDLQQRVRTHNSGTASRYTRTRLPVTVVYQELCRGRSSALRKEYAIKQLSRKEKEEYIRRKSKASAF